MLIDIIWKVQWRFLLASTQYLLMIVGKKFTKSIKISKKAYLLVSKFFNLFLKILAAEFINLLSKYQDI